MNMTEEPILPETSSEQDLIDKVEKVFNKKKEEEN